MGGLAACSNSGGGFGAVDAASDAPARDGTVHDATGADVAQSGDGGADGSGEDAVAEAEVDAEALP
jgi:hypothetical protein